MPYRFAVAPQHRSNSVIVESNESTLAFRQDILTSFDWSFLSDNFQYVRSKAGLAVVVLTDTVHKLAELFWLAFPKPFPNIFLDSRSIHVKFRESGKKLKGWG